MIDPAVYTRQIDRIQDITPAPADARTRGRGRPYSPVFDTAVRDYLGRVAEAGLATADTSAGCVRASAEASAAAAVRARRPPGGRTAPDDVEAALLAAEAAALRAAGGVLSAAQFRRALRVRGVDPALILRARHAASGDGRPSPYPVRVRVTDPVATARRQVSALDHAGPAERAAQNRRWAAEFRRSQRPGVRQ